jgi:uncharacterized membrane protein
MSALAVALALFALGFTLVAAGVLLIALSALRRGRKLEGGAVLVIGPLPIAIGTSERITRALLALAIALMVLTFMLFLFFNWSAGSAFKGVVSP